MQEERIDWPVRENVLRDLIRVFNFWGRSDKPKVYVDNGYGSGPGLWIPLSLVFPELLKENQWSKHRGGLTAKMLIAYLQAFDIDPEKALWVDGKRHYGYNKMSLLHEWQWVLRMRAEGK